MPEPCAAPRPGATTSTGPCAASGLPSSTDEPRSAGGPPSSAAVPASAYGPCSAGSPRSSADGPHVEALLGLPGWRMATRPVGLTWPEGPVQLQHMLAHAVPTLAGRPPPPKVVPIPPETNEHVMLTRGNWETWFPSTKGTF